MTVSYEFPRPALTADIVVFALDEDDLKVTMERLEISMASPVRGLRPFLGDFFLTLSDPK